MKTTNLLSFALLSIISIFFLGSCKDDRIGEIGAGINATCGGALNFEGDHVFAYKDSGLFGTTMLVGGYTFGDDDELGFFIPWPPAVGTYTLTGITSYYDPGNDGTDEYGGSGSGQLSITSLDRDGDNIKSIELSFQDVEVIRSGTDVLCMDDGRLKLE